MIAFDTFTLAAVASELRRVLEAARVQKVQQPSANEIILSLYGRGGAHRLLLCADPQTFRVHLTQIKRDNPVTAPGFCQVCRKYLEGAWLDEVAMPHFDRVLWLGFRTHDGERAALVAELMGRNSNLVLTSGAGMVRGILRPAPPSEKRVLRVGQPYEDPPGYGEKPDPPNVPPQELLRSPVPSPNDNPKAVKTWLMNTFGGIGPFAAEEIIARARQSGDSVGVVLAALMADVYQEKFAPHSIMDDTATATEGVWAFAPVSVPAARRFARDSVSVALDTFYSTRLREATESGEQNDLRRALAREIAYREREVESARATLAESARADDYEHQGNLLLAGLANVERGAASVTLPDLYAPDADAKRTITLDPKRGPRENAEACFERARKARDAREHAEARLEDLEADLSALRELAAQTEDDAADLDALRERLKEIVGAKRAAAGATAPAAKAARPKEKAFGGHRVRTYTVDGYDLWVGETAEANDYLVTRAASPTDLWLHVRAGVGAHGILRTQGQPTRVGDPTVRRAAEIVAARSGKSVKHTDLIAVDVTEKRYVRKPRGAKPGLVTYERERTLDVSPAL